MPSPVFISMQTATSPPFLAKGEAHFLLFGPWMVEFEPPLALVWYACFVSYASDSESLSHITQYAVLLFE